MNGLDSPIDNVVISDFKVRRNKVACLGAGYVGGPTMAVMSQYNPDTEFYVLDVNPARIAAWNSPELPIYEIGLQDIVNKQRGKNLFFSSDVERYIEECDILFVAVNTPTKTSGIGKGAACDLSNWELAARSIAKHAKTDKIIVEKSTVPVRTAASISVIFAMNSQARFCILSNPEFLAEGSAIADLEKPDRILIGCPSNGPGEYSYGVLSSLYAQWVPKERITMTNLWSSELSKLVANAFLAQRVSSINSISAICEVTGADIRQVSQVVGQDTRIGSKFLQASIGFGGSCFEKDLKSLCYIAESLGLIEVSEYWDQVLKMNMFQKKRISHRIVSQMFDTVRGKKIALLGFAFKKNTHDVRETPALDVCKILFEDGAIIHCYDPKVNREAAIREMKAHSGFESVDFDKHFIMCSSVMEAVECAHAAVVCTEWDEFREVDYTKVFEVMFKPAFIFDARNILDMHDLHSIGFEVISVGAASLIRSKVEKQSGFCTPQR